MDVKDASSPLAHYKAILAYDGTNFAGFQKQAKSRTVQGELEAALRQLGWTQRSIQAAGRTDAGVHASGQVIAFGLVWTRSLNTLLNALNAHLPLDIAVQQLEVVRYDFRPRFDALARRYQYSLFCQPVRNPINERYAWRVWPEVDFKILEQTAKLLVGTHNFQAFGTPPHSGGSTIRNVFVSTWEQTTAKAEFIYEIEANAFLFHMVRRIVRLQITIAQGKLPVESISMYLSDEHRDPVKGLAPPHGLNLSAVRYADSALS